MPIKKEPEKEKSGQAPQLKLPMNLPPKPMAKKT